VARGHLPEDTPLNTGKRDGGPVSALPVPLTAELLRRGQVRFEAFCAPCHGLTGRGDGMIVQRGFKAPLSYHTERLRQAPIGYFFDVITHGYGAMADYSAQVPIEDRWAIAAYIRALQLSQAATLADVPEEKRPLLDKVGAEPGPGAGSAPHP
jgi:mono/diheme cytochrome c family protein